MKKAMKSALTLVLIIATLFTLSPLASAATKPAIKIMLGGKVLSVSPILTQGGHTYAPYDSLFKALGAKASYDEETQAITAVSGTTTIIFSVEDYTMTVSTDGVENWYCTEGAPILDTVTRKIYVPIRDTAQALGYVVSWDSSSRAITLRSVDDLIKSSGATYTVIDKYLAFNNQLMSNNKALDGTFSLTADMNSLYFDNYYYYEYYDDTNSETEIVEIPPLTINGAATGVFDLSGSEMSINLKSNASSVIPQLIAEESIDDGTKALLGELDNTDISLIVNNETGLIYVKSPLICVISGQAEDAWLCLETGESLSSTDLSDLSGFSIFSVGNVSSFRDYVSASLKQELIYDDGDYVIDTLNELNARFSDQAMVKDGEDYVLTYSYDNSDDEDYYFHSKESSKLVFQFDGETFSGVSYSMLSSVCGSYSNYYDGNALGEELDTSSTELTYSFTAVGKGSLSITTVSNGVTELMLKVNYAFSDTTATPSREPAEGSNIVSVFSLGELSESLMAGLSEAGLPA
ncbi:MAG: hypothetical protein CVU91_06135 [Firmicutes bacterium HGW-Firmicutes-16]|nr:MAG: hypothetical protein CVU91_06135 [Firmicutes bacterium HGW-Firmicutes-16]